MELRDRLVLALDTDDLVMALRLARHLQPWFGVAKVGLELFTAAGPDAVAAIADSGFRVFLDLKMHDIPTTVRRAARVVGALGASYLTLHAHGGPGMLRAGVDGLNEGAAAAGVDPPMAVAVTVLTSDTGAPEHILGKRIVAAVEGGCGGIVCAASDVREAKQLAPRMTAVVPGIRLPGADVHDQARAGTPQLALTAGADLLVIGRPVTKADDPVAAAKALTEALTG
ncbi:MAG: orotidine-5'-phosphate decarboxylase [Actinomycetota bacterium]|nr:orotidine-5'-phosphate decarboxylase [Actinomycetota bacterium]